MNKLYIKNKLSVEILLQLIIMNLMRNKVPDQTKNKNNYYNKLKFGHRKWHVRLVIKTFNTQHDERHYNRMQE